MQIALAPMEGLVDNILRDVLTRIGGVDWCVSEFVRVTRQLLPPRSFHALAPELRDGSRTPQGTSMRIQLLGSDPHCLADNAARAVELGAPVIDLNFGCPAKTVNRSRGGAVLLQEPDLLFRILQAVRDTVPGAIPVTAKMRLGYTDKSLALDCARALAAGGAESIVVHARTKTDGYRPPAHWEWIARIQDVVSVPVYANGEIWTVDDWRRCREVSGAKQLMLGRGLVARPDLALQIRALEQGQHYRAMDWIALAPSVRYFWQRVREKFMPRSAPGRLKQWLGWMRRSYPEAESLFMRIRRENDSAALDQVVAQL